MIVLQFNCQASKVFVMKQLHVQIILQFIKKKNTLLGFRFYLKLITTIKKFSYNSITLYLNMLSCLLFSQIYNILIKEKMQEDNFQPLISKEDYELLVQKSKKLDQLEKNHIQSLRQIQSLGRQIKKCSRIIDEKQSYIEYIKRMIKKFFQDNITETMSPKKKGEMSKKDGETQFIELQDEQDFHELTKEIQIEQCHAFFSKQEQILNGLKERFESHNYYISKLQEQIKQFNSDQIVKTNHLLEQNIQQTKVNYQKLKQQKTLLQKQVQNGKNIVLNLQMKIQELNKNVLEINTKTIQKDMEIEDLQKKQKIYKEKIIKYQNALGRLQRQIKEIETQIITIRMELRDEKSKVKEMENSVKYLTQLRNHSKQNLEILAQQHQQLLQKYRLLQQKADSQNMSVSQYQQQDEIQKKSIKNLSKIISDLQNSLKTKQSQIQSLKLKQQRISKGQKSYKIKQLINQYKQQLITNLRDMGGLNEKEVAQIIESEFKTLAIYISKASKN